ncbi:hypothetical protein E4T56_gene3550 [Termitomyces sp. T112]|nr:hypothetical protein E4T56_gene3550 [Termitomyces sp. T112]
MTHSLDPQPCSQPACFPGAPPNTLSNTPNPHPPSAPTPGNSDTSSANPNSPLANSDTFPAAVNAFYDSPELLEPSPTVSDSATMPHLLPSLGLFKLALLQFEVELVLVEAFQDKASDPMVLFQHFGMDEDVIEVYTHYALHDEVPEDVVHHGLEGGRAVGESEEHNKWLEQSLMSSLVKYCAPQRLLMSSEIVMTHSLGSQPCSQPACFSGASPDTLSNSSNLCPPSAPTPGNSNTSPANPDSPLANSNAFPAAINASPDSPEPLGPSSAVPDSNMHHQLISLVCPTNSRAL